MPASGPHASHPTKPVLMRIELRAGVVLAGAPVGGLEVSGLEAGVKVLERSERDCLIAFEEGELAAFQRAARRASELCGSVPPVAVALHAPCTDAEPSDPLLARALGLARPGEVLVTEAFWRLAKDHFSFEALPDRLFRLGAPKPGLADVFIGRDAELHQLRTCWETARLGRPLLVSIQGEAGIGKSRLLQAFRSGLGSGPRVVAACSLQDEQHRPYALLASLVAAFGLPLGQLAQAIGPSGADLDFLLGSLGAGAPVQPRHRQFRAFRGLNQALTQRFGTTPTVIVLEDLHWADEASLAWLDSLVAELSFAEHSPPWLLVATERGREIHRRYAGMGIGAIAVPLLRLDDRAAEELVAALAPELPAAMRSAVRDRSDGNPLYLREFARLARQEGSPEPMPETVRWELDHRLQALSPAERRVLELASVLGTSFDQELLGRLVEVPGYRQVLANLTGGGLLVRRGAAIAFSHHLLQEATYGSMAPERRRALHAMVAHTLETQGSEPGSVARHYLRSPRPAHARPHLLKAARMARERHALQAARDSLRQAVRAGSETDPLAQAIRLELAEVLLALGEFAAARSELGSLRPVVSDDDRVRMALLASQLDERSGAYSTAVAALCEAGTALDPGPRARLLLAEASLHLRQGAFADCRALAERALDLVTEEASPERAMAHSLLGIARYRLEGPEWALADYLEALALREAVGEPAAIGGSLSNLGIAYYELGRWDEALACFDRAHATFRSIGERWQLTVVLNNQGHLLLNRGDVEAAEARYREALLLKREMGEEPGVAIALCNLGNALSRRQAFDEARACLQEAVLVLERLGEQETLAEVYQVYGMLELASGDRPRARLLLQRALDKSHAVRRDGPRAIALRGLAQLAAEEEYWEQSALYAWESVQLNDRLQNPLELGRSLAVWGTAQQALGDVEQAMDAFDKASVLFRQLGALPDVRAIVDRLS